MKKRTASQSQAEQNTKTEDSRREEDRGKRKIYKKKELLNIFKEEYDFKQPQYK